MVYARDGKHHVTISVKLQPLYTCTAALQWMEITRVFCQQRLIICIYVLLPYKGCKASMYVISKGCTYVDTYCCSTRDGKYQGMLSVKAALLYIYTAEVQGVESFRVCCQ